MPPLLVGLALLQLAAAPGVDSGLAGSRVEREAWVMGTRLGIVVEAADSALAASGAETALREVERMEALLSTWDPTTPLGRLNRAPPGAWTPVAPELDALLHEADGWAVRTGGTFDPRVGALVDAWDLRGVGRTPGERELALALAAAGPGSVELADGRLRRASASAWIDAGGFGKGAALRSATSMVDASSEGCGVRILIDLGGQVVARASAHAPWVVDVAHPAQRSQPVARLALHDRSVATSGTSERGRHILDPRNGRPVPAWGSVTVVHPDALAADALSTALHVMGPTEGLAWGEASGVAALFLDSSGGTLRASWTSHLEPWLIESDIHDIHHQRKVREP